MHRRLLQDDFRGVGEPLDDNTIVTSTMRLSFEPQVQVPPNSATDVEYYQSYLINYPLELHYVTGFDTIAGFLKSAKAQASLLRSGLDFRQNKAHVVSYKLLDGQDGTILLRIGNLVSRDEGKAQSACVSLPGLIKCPVRSVQETSITTINNIQVLPPSQWTNVCIQPKQIRTFLVNCMARRPIWPKTYVWMDDSFKGASFSPDLHL